jgi:6-phosphogluconolactonase
MTSIAWGRPCLALPLLSILAASIGWAQPPAATSGSRRATLYAATGPELAQYDVDGENATLIKRGSVTLPANVQYAWPHPSRQYLYVAWSNGGPGSTGSSGSQHGATAFRIDPVSGALHPLGQPVSLPSRPIHVSIDISGTHMLVAYNDPSGVTVHRLGSDGTVLSQVKQPARLDVGIYAHQVRADPSNQMVTLVTRGNGPTRDKPEDPGALKIFGYKDGLLTNRASIAPSGGFNFQPRHLDFHSSRPWIFVSLERQSKLQVYKILEDGMLSPRPLFTKDSLADPAHARPGQAAGTVHLHPNGRYLYQANRAGDASGGENNIAVYAIDQDTGEPTLVQNIDTRGFTPRTFALDPSGRILVAANQTPLGAVSASLAVFRIRDDGRLDFARKYDVDAGGSRSLFWMGIVPLP